MPDLNTTYTAVRGALVDAINAAWSPTGIYFRPFAVPEDYTGGYPVVFIKVDIPGWENETAVTDELTVAFEITGIFQNDVTDGNDLASVANIALAQAELYGIANMGNYGYLGQMTDPVMEDLEGNNRYMVGFTYRCNISIDRV